MGTHPFDQMPRVLNTRAEQIRGNAKSIVQLAARVIDRGLVVETPVDTGRARSNWVTTLDVPFEGTIPAYAPGNKLGKVERANATAAIGQARRVIKTYNPKKNKSIFISNSVKDPVTGFGYIGLLNTGTHSTQTAALFVQRAIAAGIEAIRGRKLIGKETTLRFRGN